MFITPFANQIGKNVDIAGQLGCCRGEAHLQVALQLMRPDPGWALGRDQSVACRALADRFPASGCLNLMAKEEQVAAEAPKTVQGRHEDALHPRAEVALVAPKALQE